MDVSYLALYAGSICAAGCVGMWVLPFLAHRMLMHKHQQIHHYWMSCLSEYQSLGSYEHTPKTLELWLQDCKRLVANSVLPREYALDLMAINPCVLGSCDTKKLPSYSQRKELYCNPLPRSWRLLSAGTNAIFVGMCLQSSVPALVGISFWCALCYCIILALIDARAHILPFEMTLGLIPLGLCVQGVLIGLGFIGWLEAAGGAICYCIMLFGAAGLTHLVTKKPATGQGDIRATPGYSLLCAAFPLVALGATALSMAGALVILRIKSALTLSDAIPFGPFLTFGVFIGMSLFICTFI